MKNSYFGISWLQDGKTNVKFRIDWLIPLSISLMYLMINLWFFDFNKQVIFFQSNAFDKILSLFQILPGFYIAALAAVVSIQPKETKSEDNEKEKSRAGKLDSVDDKRLRGYLNGIERIFPIRLLLTRGLAYLAITSLLLIIVSTGINYLIEIKVLNYAIGALNNTSTPKFVMIFIDTFFIFVIAQILSITIFITKFLGDEINRI